jgi:hypothetical protein
MHYMLWEKGGISEQRVIIYMCVGVVKNILFIVFQKVFLQWSTFRSEM